MENHYVFISILEGLSFGFRDQALEEFVTSSTGCSHEEFNKAFLYAFEQQAS
jgi:hypothetical protein